MNAPIGVVDLASLVGVVDLAIRQFIVAIVDQESLQDDEQQTTK